MVCLALLCGCAAQTPSASPDSDTLLPAHTAAPAQNREDALTIAMSSKDESINPYLCESYKTYNVLSLVYETMLTLDAQGNPQPGLFETWQIREDGSVLFTVRKNVKFHNGQTLAPQHFIDALTFIRDEAPQGACGGVLAYVRSFRLAPDGQGVILMPRKGVYPMLCALTVPVALLGETLSGTGPYEVESFIAGRGMDLKRNESWWRVAPKIERIRVNAQEDDQLRALALGQIDLACTRDTGISAYKSTAGFTALSVQSALFVFFALNLREDAPLSDDNLRRALYYALDNKEMVHKVFQNNAVAAELPLTSSNFVYGNLNLPLHEADLARAQEMIGLSAYSDHNGDGFLDQMDAQGNYIPLVLRVLVASDSADPVHSDLAAMAVQNLASAGILCETVTCKSKDLEKKLAAGEFDLAVLCADLGALPDLSLLYDSQGALNFSGYASAEMDENLQAIKQAADLDALCQAYQAVCTQALEDLPIIGVGLRLYTLLYDSSIKGIGSVHYTGVFANVDEWIWMEE